MSEMHEIESEFQEDHKQMEPQDQYRRNRESNPARDQLLATLNEVFATLQAQMQEQAPRPFSGDAEKAVEAFNDIVAGLQLKFPPTPVELKVQNVTPTEVDLTWTDATNNADGYKIKRCQGQDCEDFNDLRSPLPAGARSFHDTDLSSGTIYRYRLAVFNSRGERLSSIVDVTTERQKRR